MKREIKIAYIGSGSKQWARVFMSDLALTSDLSGEIALYDIDLEAAERNAAIGQQINVNENTWQNIGTLPGGEAMGGMDLPCSILHDSYR